jgi:regulation of enolase protein 1 (concanavalin A-like superfamily)
MCKRSAYRTCLIPILCLFLVNISNAQLDPSLMGWWKLDETSGTVASDSSGNGRDGTAYGSPQWVTGQLGGSLQFDGENDYVQLPIDSVIGSPANISCSVWVNFTGQLGGYWSRVFDFGSGPEIYMFLTARGQLGTGEEPLIFGLGQAGWQDEDRVTSQFSYPEGLPTGWHHVAVTVDSENLVAILYVDGEVAGENTAMRYGPQNLGVTTQNWLGRSQYEGDAYFTGSLDDFRIYDFAMTPKDVQTVMDGGILIFEIASRPNPFDGKDEVSRTPVLNWKKGLYSDSRNIYLGTNFNDVNEASVTDPRDVLVATNYETTSFQPETLDYGKTYYWRVNEVNTAGDSTIYKGDVWNFTVVNFILVENFEGFDDANNIIYETWGDYAVNNTGMTVGYFDPPYTEQDIIHSGKQSMPLYYDNDGTVNEGTALEKTGTLFYSEAERQWTDAQDWTIDEIETLSIWFMGQRPYMGYFSEDPAGTYALRGAGEDIYGFEDQFHFAYKELTGAVKIIAKVESLDNTDPFAKAGVMIRDTLDANSRNMAVLITPENGVRFQFRLVSDDVTDREFVEGVNTPYWVQLERTSGGLIRSKYSANGSDWTSFSIKQLSVSEPMYVGLAVTSHNPDVAAEAVFSNVTITGTGSEQPWQHQDIGLINNSPEQLYVALNDSGVVYYTDPDPNATFSGVLNPDWTHWKINLQDFANQGVNLANISKLSIGIGTKDNTTTPGGIGKLYIDDIRLYRPAVE